MMGRDRYVTYVFDREYDLHREDEDSQSLRNVLGPDYHGASPVYVSEGDQLKILEEALELLREIRDGHILNVEEAVEEWFCENKEVCYF